MKNHWMRLGGPAAVAACVLAVLMIPAPELMADDALDTYNFAVGAYRQERWQQAEEAFKKFADRFPDHPKVPTARLYRGLSLTNLQDYKTARPVWREFVKDYPNNKNLPVAMYRVAESSYLLNDLKAAETEFQAFLKDYPQNDLAEWALPFLAETQLELGKPAEAVKTYKIAESRYPKSRLSNDVQLGLARSYEKLKQPDAAIEIYKKLASDQTNSLADQAQLNLATLYFETEKFTNAAEAYAAVEEKFPKSDLLPTARLNAGYAWYQVGDYRKAIQQFDKAAEAESQKMLATYWKGVSHKSLGEYKEAADILKTAYESGEAGPLTDKILYQWADSAFRSKDYAEARDLFLKVVKDWPKSSYVEDSLHLAGEAGLYYARQANEEAERIKRLDAAESIINSFPAKFPQSPLAMHHEMLKARLLYVQGGSDRYTEAAKHLRTVIEKSNVPATQLMARFHLGRTLQKLDKHEEVVEVMAPVLEEVRKTGAGSEFLSGLVIVGLSQLDLDQYKTAIARLTSYLELAPDGEEADLALSARALARAQLKENTEAKQDLVTLRDKFPNSPLLPERAYLIAEMAYDQQNWKWAAEVFDLVVKLGPKSSHYRPALSGLAWTEYQNKNYLEAATDFGRLAEEFPKGSKDRAEAAYMQGRALEDGDDLKAAAKIYQETFEQFAPPEPAPAGAEEKRPTRFAFLAGVQTARTQAELKQPELADVAYEAVLGKFPQAKDLDKLLDEWALMNLRAERFERSDEVFKMLIEKTPDSPLVDNARLSLAESEFVAGKLLEAKKEFQELATSPKSDEGVKERALFQLIEILTEQLAWEDLIKQSKTFLESFPNSEYAKTVAFRRAEALTSTGKFAEAETLLTELLNAKDNAVVAKAPWFPRVWVLLAECHFRQKSYDKVVETVEAFRAWDSKNERLYEAEEVLGRAYKNQRQWDKARAAFERSLGHSAAKGTETAAKSQLMIGETYWFQEEWKKAQENYLKVYYNYPRFPEWQAPALFQAGLCDEKLGDPEQAAKTYKELITKFRNSEYKDQAQERWAKIKSQTPKSS